MALSLAQQVEAVAAALDAPALAVAHTARKLNPDQWPNPGKGRRHGRATIRQLLNLSVAHIVGPPIAAPRVAGSIGDLPFRDGIRTMTNDEGWERQLSFVLGDDRMVGDLPVASTFGDTLAARTEAWAEAGEAGMGSSLFHAVISWPGRSFVPSAEIRYQDMATAKTRSRYELHFYKDYPTRAELGGHFYTAVLRDDLLRDLADIWRASAPDAPAPENANAETLGGASAPTRTEDRSRNGENRALLHNPDTKRTLFLSQECPSPAGGLPVPLSKGKDPPPWSPTTTS